MKQLVCFFVCLLAVPAAMVAETVPLSFVQIEPNAAGHLQLRNRYQAAATAWVLQCRSEQYPFITRFDATINPMGEPLPAGGVRDFPMLASFGRGHDDERNWIPLAVVFADGAWAGDFKLVRSILLGRQTVSEQLQIAIDLLGSNSDLQVVVEALSHQPVRRSGVFGSLVSRDVPRWLQYKVKQGLTLPEILDALRAWQRRLSDSVWALV